MSDRADVAAARARVQSLLAFHSQHVVHYAPADVAALLQELERVEADNILLRQRLALAWEAAIAPSGDIPS